MAVDMLMLSQRVESEIHRSVTFKWDENPQFWVKFMDDGLGGWVRSHSPSGRPTRDALYCAQLLMPLGNERQDLAPHTLRFFA